MLVKKTQDNIWHGKMMAAFQAYLSSKETDPKKRGNLDLKMAQLEDSVEHEEEFIEFINTKFNQE